MKKDLEATFICQHLVNEFNDKVVYILPDSRLLLNFVHNYIYEILPTNKNYKFPLYYGENFIEGQYEKLNDNQGGVKPFYDPEQPKPKN